MPLIIKPRGGGKYSTVSTVRVKKRDKCDEALVQFNPELRDFVTSSDEK